MTRSDFDSLKRVADLIVAVPALILSLPIQAVVAAKVAHELGRPVLFRQIRPGRYGRPFELVKFRTMRPIDPAAGWTDDSSRLTPFGRMLRSTSVDELPTVWNVVRGEMSLVGPRPLLMQYLPRYSPMQARRHEVRPGLTGLAQVSGRNALDWTHRLRLDVEYVDHRCFALDLSIMMRTVRTVLRRDGITGVGEATVAEFLGNERTGSTP